MLLKHPTRLLVGVAVVAIGFVAVSGAVAGCAAGTVETEPGTTQQSVSSAGGSGSGGAQGGQGGSSLCAMDCSAIMTPPCLQSVCNDGSYQGTIGDCVIAPSEIGTPCDDGVFCTVEDACDGAGQCDGGPQNDCGMMPEPCNEVTCVEATASCTQAPSMNGDPCQDPNNLCIKGSTCSNGNCIGGMPDDCFFFPVPDECHIAQCNPTNGMCEAVPGNNNAPCVDPNDLCTVGKTCANGVCQGGAPKDCSSLTMGCVLGVCDMATGNCFAQNLMNGDPCSDNNACTSGETCQSGNCLGGMPVTACINNDGCCPMNCNTTNDVDCICTPGSAQFNASGTGNTGTIQSFAVPTGCTSITIEAWGAQGGAGTDTKGARMKGTFAVTSGESLSIVVGQMADIAVSATSGGGGTFVVDSSNQPMIIAGGGGSCFSVCPASSETVGRITTSGGTAGTVVRSDNGQGGTCGNTTSGGGGGFLSNGANATGGKSWANGMIGGLGENFGGFGGGGARGGLWGEGGGGGYSGGSCGNQASVWLGCGGGGSFNSGSNQNNSPGVRVGHGMVVITW